jgi:ABC-type Fe3+ transport system permease subunit
VAGRFEVCALQVSSVTNAAAAMVGGVEGHEVSLSSHTHPPSTPRVAHSFIHAAALAGAAAVSGVIALAAAAPAARQHCRLKRCLPFLLVCVAALLQQQQKKKKKKKKFIIRI